MTDPHDSKKQKIIDLIKKIEEEKPSAYCIGTVDSFRDQECSCELHKNSPENQVLIFDDRFRWLAIRLFMNWDMEGAILPELCSYIRSIEKEREMLKEELKKSREDAASLYEILDQYGIQHDEDCDQSSYNCCKKRAQEQRVLLNLHYSY